MIDRALYAIFALCFLSLAAPVAIWWIEWIRLEEFKALRDTNILAKILMIYFSSSGESLNSILLFMAPIATGVSAIISKKPESYLVLFSVLFFISGMASFAAIFTINDVVAGRAVSVLIDVDAAQWKVLAVATLRRLAESFLSTAAVLMGLKVAQS